MNNRVSCNRENKQSCIVPGDCNRVIVNWPIVALNRGSCSSVVMQLMRLYTCKWLCIDFCIPPPKHWPIVYREIQTTETRTIVAQPNRVSWLITIFPVLPINCLLISILNWQFYWLLHCVSCDVSMICYDLLWCCYDFAMICAVILQWFALFVRRLIGLETLKSRKISSLESLAGLLACLGKFQVSETCLGSMNK